MEKQHFVFLDGLRGIAALAVGLLHASLIFRLGLRPPHAYLAVDFFFCLSGFVVAFAYDDRLKSKMTVAEFCKLRLIRLYPLILFGAILGYLATMCYLQLQGRLNFDADTLLFVATLLMLPVGMLLHHQAYPLNNPLWSLFFELFANLVYAIRRRYGSSSGYDLQPKLIIAAMALIAVAWRFSTVQTLGFSHPLTFLAGFVRVLYPFLAGVVIYKYSIFDQRIRMSSPLLAAILIAAMFLPIATKATWLYDCAVIIFVFPAIVIFGIRPNDFSNLHGIWKMFGKLSYPFYVIHWPILKFAYVICVRVGFIQNAPYLSACFGLVTAILASYPCSQLYDEPVRAWLSDRNKKRQLQLQH